MNKNTKPKDTFSVQIGPEVENAFWGGVFLALRYFDYEQYGISEEDVKGEMRIIFQECIARGNGKNLVGSNGKEIKSPYYFAKRTTENLSWKMIYAVDAQALSFDEIVQSEQKMGDDPYSSFSVEDDSISDAPKYNTAFEVVEKIISGVKDVDPDYNKSSKDDYFRYKKEKKPEDFTIDREQNLDRETKLLNTFVNFLGYKAPDFDGLEHQPGSRLEDSRTEAHFIAGDHEKMLHGINTGRNMTRSFEWLRRQRIIDEIQSGKKKGELKLNRNVVFLKMFLEFCHKLFGLEQGDMVYKLFMHSFAGVSFSVPSFDSQERMLQRVRVSLLVREEYRKYYDMDHDKEEHGEMVVCNPEQEVVWKEGEDMPQIESVEGQVSTVAEEAEEAEEPDVFEMYSWLKQFKPESYAEIGHRLNMTEDEVKNRLREEREWLSEHKQPEAEKAVLAMALVEMIETMSDLKYLEQHIIKKTFDQSDPQARMKKLRIDTEKRQLELLRKKHTEVEVQKFYDNADSVELEETTKKLSRLDKALEKT